MTSPTASRQPSVFVVNASIALLCLIWGSTWIVIQGGLTDLPPYTSAAVRFLVAGLAMSVVAWRYAKREGGSTPQRGLWIVLGSLNFAASYGIVYRTETVLPSGLVALLWGIFPILQALAAHYFLPGVQFSRKQWLGFLLGLFGLSILLWKDVEAFGERGIPAALVLFLSPVVCVVGNTYIKLKGAGSSSLLLNRNAMLLGAALLGLVAGVQERTAALHWSAAAITSVLYLALIGTVLTFGLYYWLLRFVDAHKLALISYVTPAVALLLGTTLGGEAFTPSMACGAVGILGGILLIVKA